MQLRTGTADEAGLRPERIELVRQRCAEWVEDGSHTAINRLTVGDHFGEMALLRHAPRSATIRTLTAVEVFKMSPSNFTALYTALPGFRQHLTRIMEERVVGDSTRARRPS